MPKDMLRCLCFLTSTKCWLLKAVCVREFFSFFQYSLSIHMVALDFFLCKNILLKFIISSANVLSLWWFNLLFYVKFFLNGFIIDIIKLVKTISTLLNIAFSFLQKAFVKCRLVPPVVCNLKTKIPLFIYVLLIILSCFIFKRVTFWNRMFLFEKPCIMLLIFLTLMYYFSSLLL